MESYPIYQVEKKLFTLPGWYFMFRPLRVPYRRIHDVAKRQNLEVNIENPIVEKGTAFGRGWIGVMVDAAPEMRPDLVELKGEFKIYQRSAPFAEMGKAYQQIMRDHPASREFYNLYFEGPDSPNPRWAIIFR